MKLQNKKMELSVLLIAALIVGLAAYVYSENIGSRSIASAETSQVLALARPMFSADATAATSFLDQEAGMAIWLDATGSAPLDLNGAKGVITLQENVTSDYVIGSIPLAAVGFSSDDYPHAFVHKSGWIVVYWLRVNVKNPSTTGWLGKTFPMYKDSLHTWYDKGSNLLNDNLLHYALTLICQQYSISSAGAQYYHFQYPAATKLEMAIKTCEGPGPGSMTVTYNVKVPSTVNIDEQSYSFYCTRGSSSINVDTTVIVTTPGGGRYYGDFSPLLNDTIWHVVGTTHGGSYDYGDIYATSCILLLYH